MTPESETTRQWPTLSRLPTPARVLFTAIIVVMGIAMSGALAQIIVHDILPTFFTGPGMAEHGTAAAPEPATGAGTGGRGDLFSDNGAAGEGKPEAPARGDLLGSAVAGKDVSSPNPRGDLFGEGAVPAPAMSPMLMENKQFVWLLKWTHIHLFGMSMIFIFMGTVTVFLDMSATARSWLVALPFAGILADIAAMWLKTYVSPAFFWLHIPGGGLFGIIFLFVSLRGLGELWLARREE
jgi:hypothetical protein